MNIPAHCLATEATLVDAVRRITPKEDQDFCLAHWFQMRNLRNTLVEFAGGNTKQNPTRLIIVKEKDTQDQNAVRIDHAALYHLFSSDQSNGADKFTSALAIKTEKPLQQLYSGESCLESSCGTQTRLLGLFYACQPVQVAIHWIQDYSANQTSQAHQRRASCC